MSEQTKPTPTPIVVGGLYYNTKRGSLYVLTAVGTSADDTNRRYAVYRPFGTGPSVDPWVRPVEEFVGCRETPEGPVPRFRHVEPAELKNALESFWRVNQFLGRNP